MFWCCYCFLYLLIIVDCDFFCVLIDYLFFPVVLAWVDWWAYFPATFIGILLDITEKSFLKQKLVFRFHTYAMCF